MNLTFRLFWISTLLGTLVFHRVEAKVSVPKLISDGMVLQRNSKLNIWGWAAPAEKITVKFNNRAYKVTTDAGGKWLVQLTAMKAGGPYNMDINGSNHIFIKNILIGDVWFCSGQSNMVLPIERVKEKYPDEVANANYRQIRNFFIPAVSDVSKEYHDLPSGQWVAADSNGILNFGATSYFFAKQLYLKYQVPIGIINSSVGGTPIQAWISEEGIKQILPYNSRVAQLKDTAYLNRLMLQTSALNKAVNPPVSPTDKGLTDAVKWYETAYKPEGWHKFWLPGYWADQGVKDLNGVVWFRKEVEVPASMVGKPIKLFMGRIVDADEIYINGVKIGNTTYQYPPRRYVVPAGLLQAGKNLMVIRITNTSGKGGFVPEKRYELTDGITSVDMRGDWQYQVGQIYSPIYSSGGENSFPFSAQDEPTGLYNTMVAPVTNYSIKGFLWYQGESNTGKPQEYTQLLRSLIADWRKKWHTGILPFIYAQLPNFMEVQYSPSESTWAELRDAQLKALSVTNTGMAVAIDAGEWNDIHPLNKKDVGERLALAAEKIAYGDKKVVDSGPVYHSAKIEDNEIVINFISTGGGLVVKGGGKLMHFAIASADKKFIWADARIEGDKVIVSGTNLTKPMYVRYAWADNPEFANLYNKEGLPASPFQIEVSN